MLAALALVFVVLCLRGVLPRLGAVAPTTLAFMGACVGVLGATVDDTTAVQRRAALVATLVATLVLVVACGLLLRALAAPA